MSKTLLVIYSGAAVLSLGIVVWYFWSSSEESKTSFSNTTEEERGEESVSPKSEEPVREPERADEGTGQAQEAGTQPEAQKKESEKEAAKQEEEPESAESENDGSMPKVTNRLMSSGFRASSGRKIDTIVIHSSYDALGDDPYSVSGLIKEYEEYGVSAHYLIDRKGIIYRLVKDKDVSYHAGSSKMPDGRTNVNEFSIGIELMNTKEDEYTSAQYASLQRLVDGLKSEYSIKYVLGHDEIAPDRKTDPWNFDWKKLKK